MYVTGKITYVTILNKINFKNLTIGTILKKINFALCKIYSSLLNYLEENYSNENYFFYKHWKIKIYM